MSLLTMTDCADADNRVQARYELDASVADSGYTKIAAWAMKWGRELLDYADAAPSEDDVATELQNAKTEADDAAQSASERADAIRAAISKLDAITAELENSL